MSFNKIIIVGHIGQEPRINTANGKTVANYSIATTYKAGSTEETIWFSCVSWEKQAEFIQKYVGKGTMLYVEGRLRMSKYTDNQGQERMTPEVIVSNVQLLSKAAAGNAIDDDDMPE